jgi:hypothetical protein
MKSGRRHALDVLAALDRCSEGCNTFWAVVHESGRNSACVKYALDALVEHGAIVRPWPGRWLITERGRIALALRAGRIERARHQLEGRRRAQMETRP